MTILHLEEVLQLSQMGLSKTFVVLRLKARRPKIFHDARKVRHSVQRHLLLRKLFAHDVRKVRQSVQRHLLLRKLLAHDARKVRQSVQTSCAS
jgi:hypothetical protein